MSGTWPTDVAPSDVTLRSNQPIIEDMAESGKSQRRIVAGHVWEITLDYPEMLRSEFEPYYAFALSQRGGTFQVALPNKATPLGSISGSVNINGTGAVGDLVMNIEGFTPGATDVLKAGDIVNPSGHSKVYMIASDADAGATSALLLESGDYLLLEDGSSDLLLESTGQASVSIVPPLAESLSDGESVNHTGVEFTVAIRGDIQEYKTRAPNLSQYSINLIEAL